MMSNDYAYFNAVASTVIRQLQQGTASWVRPWRPAAAFLPYNPVTEKRYHATNSIALLAQAEERGYADRRWVTSAQAQSLGAEVKTAERNHGTVLQYWKFGDSPDAHTQYTNPRVFSAVVFNGDQLDGLPAESDGLTMPAWERHERADALLHASGMRLVHQSGLREFYDPYTDRATLPEREQFPSVDRYYAAAVHQVIHASGHPARLDRDLRYPAGSTGFAVEEIDAGIASLILGGELQIGHDIGHHAPYIGVWIDILRKEPTQLLRAAAEAEKIRDFLVSNVPQQRVEYQKSVLGASLRPHTIADVLNDELLPDRLRVALGIDPMTGSDITGVFLDHRGRGAIEPPEQSARWFLATNGAAWRSFASELRTWWRSQEHERRTTVSHSTTRDELNRELESHGLQVDFDDERTTQRLRVASGFKLYRRTDGSPVLEPPAAFADREILKSFPWATSAGEILQWWNDYQATTGRVLDVPVETVLKDPRYDFHNLQSIPTGTLATALAIHGINTIRDVVGRDEGNFVTTALDVLSPVFGLAPDFDTMTSAYIERKGAAQAFAAIAQERVEASRVRADRFVVTAEGRAVFEHNSLREAVSTLVTWNLLQNPALYLKPSGDADFESRRAAPGNPNLPTPRNDPARNPLVYSDWYNDGSEHKFLCGVRDLKAYVDAIWSSQDTYLMEQDALRAIERHKLSVYNTISDGAAVQANFRDSRESDSRPNIATERVFLRVPYPEKDEANRLGASWDDTARSWYAPPGADLSRLARWLPTAGAEAVPTDPREEFAAALRQAGLLIEGLPEMDGVLHRIRVEGDRGAQRSGAYVGHLDGHPAGFLENFKTGCRTNWKSQAPSQKLSASDLERLQREATERQQQRREERLRQQQGVALAVERLLSQTPLAPEDYPYLLRKGFTDNRHRLHVDEAGNLLLPAHDIDGKVWSVQRITKSGVKLNEEGGRMEGSHLLLLGDQRGIRTADPAGLYHAETALIVAESYATARTLERASGLPVAVSYSSGNILRVAQAYRQKFPHLNIIIAGDNDHRKPLEIGPDGKPKKNVGKEKAEAAATEVDGYALLPPFTPEELGSDWNDLEQSRGVEAARALIKDGIAVALVNIDAKRVTAGLVRFPVSHREPDQDRPSGPELGYVMAPTMEEAREKLRRGEWVATQSRAIISVPQIDVFDSNMASADRERADAQRTIDGDRLRLADTKGTGHNGESVAETLRSDEATAQRAETPVQARATLDMMREAAEGEADRQSVRDQRRERRHSRTR